MIECIQTAVRARTWDELDAAMHDVEAAARRGAFDAADAQLLQRVIRLDSTGRSTLAQAFAELSDRIEQIQAECAARRTLGQPVGKVRAINLLVMHSGVGSNERDRAVARAPGVSAR